MAFEKQETSSKGNLPNDKKGRFGQTLVFPLTIKHPTDESVSITLENVLIDVGCTKRIDICNPNYDDKRTKAQRGSYLNGTIKTFVGHDDFTLNIKGVICSDNPNDYPIEEIKTLLLILQQGTTDGGNVPSLPVGSDYLLFFDIYDIVIVDYDFPQMEGTQNTQSFTIRALSNRPIELIELI